MEKSASPFHAPKTGKRASSVIQQIFAAEHPDHFTRSIPAQRLYLAVKEQGLTSSAEIIEMASREQIQLMLDFDLWSYDQFEEDQIWSWLELPDSTEGLEILQKLLKSLDPKLIAMLMAKHTDVICEDEKTENPPEGGFYTPDTGHTWIRVNLEEPHQEFLLKRLLALIFETSTELFYQLIQIPSVATLSALEEDSYQEKTKRLASEGFPDEEWAAQLNSAAPISQTLSNINNQKKKEPVKDIYSIPAFIQSYSIPRPLRDLLEQLSTNEELEQELTLICNSALIHFRIPTWEQEQVFSLIEQVRGALNIGLTTLLENTENVSALDIYGAVGLKGLYQTGLSKLFPLRNSANRISDDQCENDPKLLTFLSGLRFPFPKIPTFLKEDGEFSEVDGKLEAGFRVLESIEDVNVTEIVLSKLEKQPAST